MAQALICCKSPQYPDHNTTKLLTSYYIYPALDPSHHSEHFSNETSPPMRTIYYFRTALLHHAFICYR